jgi:hypothetical protein
MRGVVYRMYDEAGTLLYVGSSSNIGRRLSQHQSDTAWFPAVVRIDVEHHSELAAARAAEARTIVAEAPLMNRYAPLSAIGAPDASPEGEDADLISVAEATRILGCSVPTICRRIATGRLVPAKKLPGIRGAFLLRRADVEAILNPA